MSFISDLLIEISSFRIRVGNKLNTLANRIGDLTALTTSNKNNLVDAINEVNGNTDNIEIGGRNLIREVDIMSLGSNASKGIDAFGQYIRFITLNSGSPQFTHIKYQNNTQYTLSIEASVETGSHLFWYFVYTDGSNSGLYTTIYINTATPIIRRATSAINKTIDYIAYSWASGGYRRIYNIKLEKGNKATDWTPAPEDQVADWSQNDPTQFDYIKNKPTIPNGQLTVNTTSDLVGGYVYFPNGNVTTTLGLATHVLNAIADGQTAYSWGDFRDYGLGVNTASIYNSWGLTVGGTSFIANSGHNSNILPNTSVLFGFKQVYGGAYGGEIGYRNSRIAFRTIDAGTVGNWLEFYHTGNFNPAQYVLQSALNTQLANYVPINGVTTINNTKTFTSSPVVPNGTLNGHAVNLGQLNTILSAYALASAIPTNNNQLTNGAGYITAAALGGYVQQSSLNTQLANYVTLGSVQTITATKTFTVSPIVPNGTLSGHTVNLGQMQAYVTGLGYTTMTSVQTWVNSQNYATSASVGNGTVVLQGLGYLSGTATFSMNQSGNTVGSFDLTQTAKNYIGLGTEAYSKFAGYFGGVERYFHNHDVQSEGSYVDASQNIHTFVTTTKMGTNSVDISTHVLDGAELVVQGNSGGMTTFYLPWMDPDGNTYDQIDMEMGAQRFFWIEKEGVWKIV